MWSSILKISFTLFVIGLVIALLPTTPTLPTGVTDAITLFTGYANSMSQMFPVATLWTILKLILATESIILVYRITMWLIRRFSQGS